MTEESEDNSPSLQPRQTTSGTKKILNFYIQKIPEINVSEWDLIPEKNMKKYWIAEKLELGMHRTKKCTI